MIIRKETPGDVDAITAVTMAAFKDHPVGHPTEHFIVHALRAAGAMTLSLVTELDGRVVGHIAFSPITISDGTSNWHGIGPLSVLPEFQRQGIGKALVERGLVMVRDMGSQGCALVGEPGYYNRFGFRAYPGLIHEGVPPEVFLILPFTEQVPSGQVHFHNAFLATE
jgi:putative acetyltransferase